MSLLDDFVTRCLPSTSYAYKTTWILGFYFFFFFLGGVLVVYGNPIVATRAIYFMVHCDKSPDKTTLLFAEFRMKLIFSTLI